MGVPEGSSGPGVPDGGDVLATVAVGVVVVVVLAGVVVVVGLVLAGDDDELMPVAGATRRVALVAIRPFTGR
jgi:hypothetical protein